MWDELHKKEVRYLNCQGVKLAENTYKGLSYQSVDGDPVVLTETVTTGFGKDNKEDMDIEIENILSNTCSNGISGNGEVHLKIILDNNRDFFRLKLGRDSPENVPLLKIEVKAGGRPYMSPQRRHAPLRKLFIIRTIRVLEEIGAVYRIPFSNRASTSLAVTKPGTAKLRFTGGLRGTKAYKSRAKCDAASGFKAIGIRRKPIPFEVGLLPRILEFKPGTGIPGDRTSWDSDARLYNLLLGCFKAVWTGQTIQSL